MKSFFLQLLPVVFGYAMMLLMGDQRRSLLTTRNVFGAMHDVQQKWLANIKAAQEQGDTLEIMRNVERLHGSVELNQAMFAAHLNNDVPFIRRLRKRAFDRMDRKKALESLGVK